MFIKLMPDQVTLFWEDIKRGMIKSYEVPEKFQQDFAIKELKNLLSGLSQCWMGTELDEAGDRKICFVMTSKITEDRNYGIRTLFVDSIYGVRLITDELSDEAYKCMVSFAKSNDCHTITAEYTGKRIERFLTNQGFEKHRTICRKII